MEEAFEGADIVYPKSWAPYQVMQKRTDLLRAKDQDGLKELEKQCLAHNAEYKNWECDEAKMKRTKGGEALYMHCLPADITDVSCKAGEVSANVFEKYRIPTYKEAGYKPYVIAAMIFLAKMKDGVIMQCGTPVDIYAKPENPFVASFIGISNFIGCKVGQGVQPGMARVQVENAIDLSIAVRKPYTGEGIISARPEQLRISDEGMPATIMLSTFLGDFIEYEVLLDNGQTLQLNEYTKDTEKLYPDGAKIHVTFDPARVSLYTGDTQEVLSI